MYLLPQYGQLYSGGDRIIVVAKESRELPPTSWKIGNLPLNLTGFTYNGFGGDLESRTPSVMELLLGRATEYQISQLSVGARLESLEWFKPLAERKNHSSLMIVRKDAQPLHLPLNLKMFGNLVSVKCSHKLPVYSNDPSAHSCNLNGRLQDNTAVSISFNSGNDLEGHWPSVHKAEDHWPPVIRELEEALLNLQDTKVGDTRCN